MTTFEKLYRAGFRTLVSVIPPGAPLAPSSRIPRDQLGKVPGVQYESGLWGGYNWTKHVPTDDDIHYWGQSGANIGIKADWHPGLDIDSLDETLAAEIEQLAYEILGPAPVRFGRRPKRLLMYRTGEPFARLAIVIRRGGVEHLIEFLGMGRQYLIGGVHPSGARYEWWTEWAVGFNRVRCDPMRTDLTQWGEKDFTWITLDKVHDFFDTLVELYGEENVTRVGDGRKAAEAAGPQTDLLAPSIVALAECIAAIPNTRDLIDGRAAYVQFGEAVHAAAGPEREEEGFETFAEWCSRHDDEAHRGSAEDWRADWRRFHPPHAIGWGWLADLAARFGFNRAAHEVDAEPPRQEEIDTTPPELSDAWLADRVVEESGNLLRYCALQGAWYVWDGARWARDALQLADYRIGLVLRRYAAIVMRRGATEQERKQSAVLAGRICSAAKHRDVRQLLRHDPRITTLPDVFDADPWLLNTPAGIVDLRTGEMGPHDPDKMCSRMVAAAPDFSAPCPVWDQFLLESTRGDIQLEAYLRRLAGYALAGDPSEEMLGFIWGEAGAGKSKFVGAISGMMGDYHVEAAMETFVASNFDRHPADLAALAGARLVTASETQDGRRWDEARVKKLTGRDRISARFMRENFFTFLVRFTLLFHGNYRPAIRSLDRAMRRRIHLIPFTNPVPEERRDPHLPEKFAAEYPAILAWAIRGCMEWQDGGLRPPESVAAATDEYFEDEDPVGRWLEERCETGNRFAASMTDLFRSWEQWANGVGEYVGNSKRLSAVLAARGFERWREAGTGRRGYSGVKPKDDLQEAVL